MADSVSGWSTDLTLRTCAHSFSGAQASLSTGKPSQKPISILMMYFILWE
jgi:hypothetical protein